MEEVLRAAEGKINRLEKLLEEKEVIDNENNENTEMSLAMLQTEVQINVKKFKDAESKLQDAESKLRDAEAVLRGLRQLCAKSEIITKMSEHSAKKSTDISELKSLLDCKTAKDWLEGQQKADEAKAAESAWQAWCANGGQNTCTVGVSLRVPHLADTAQFQAVTAKIKSLGGK